MLWGEVGSWGQAVGIGTFSAPSNPRTASPDLEWALDYFLPFRLTLCMGENSGKPCCPLICWGRLLGRQAPLVHQVLGPEFVESGPCVPSACSFRARLTSGRSCLGAGQPSGTRGVHAESSRVGTPSPGSGREWVSGKGEQHGPPHGGWLCGVSRWEEQIAPSSWCVGCVCACVTPRAGPVNRNGMTSGHGIVLMA